MLPTPRARKLAEPIRQALNTLEHGLRDDEEFDFARSEREFVIAVEDYGESVILPGFIRWLADVAPNLRMRIRAESSAQLAVELREGTVDLALDYFTLPDANYRHACVLTETLLSLSRRDHPLLGERMNLEQYLALRHVMLAAPANARPMIDLALAKRGLQRRIAMRVPHFISMPLMVLASDMICTLPRRMATLYADHFKLRAHAVPLRMPQFPVYLIWHQRLDADAGHQWFRTHLTEFCQRL
jgi:DNA-binding transcriptional LysR family regulator